MMKRILAVLAVSVVTGIAVGVLAGTLAGVGVFAGAAVIGSIAVVLWRNQRDLEELKAGQVPPAVDRALGDDPHERSGGR